MRFGLAELTLAGLQGHFRQAWATVLLRRPATNMGENEVASEFPGYYLRSKSHA